MSRIDHRPIRNDLVSKAASLLLGPMSEREEIESAPSDTYLTGMLWPAGEPLAAVEDDQNDGPPSDLDGETDAGVPGYRAVRPCSLGLTFAADAGAKVCVSTANTARYFLIEKKSSVDMPEMPVSIETRREPEAEEVKDADGKVGKDEKSKARAARIRARRPLGYVFEILPGEAKTWRVHDFKNSEGRSVHDPAVCVHVRRRIVGSQQVLTITLINKAGETDEHSRDEACLFQSGLAIEAIASDGGGAIRPRPMVAGGDDEDAQSSALLYRDVLEYAVGHGIAVMWDAAPEKRVSLLETSWMPFAAVKNMSASGHPSLEKFLAAHPRALSAEWLSDHGARGSIVDTLNGFADVYAAWITENLAGRLNGFDGSLHVTAKRHVDLCNDVLLRIRKGVATLSGNSDAWKAFTLANSAMDRQARFEVKGDRRGPLIWRPFQIAYILLVIPGLVDPADADANCVDLLWFPTGGGKTEAYLGLSAFQIFLRRLTDARRRRDGGVDVLMRYTLRLLTVQQFQRAASLICACDAIRLERTDLGQAPISLGLYVGGDATPNRAGDAMEALRQEHDGQKPKSTPRQLLQCPVCGADLDETCYSAVGVDQGIEIRCSRRSCPTSGEPLPVLTVDDFLYRDPPSMLIGTVDKFAQLPRRKDLRALFGLDGGLRPGLIIQDELHLISGPLGSMVGLYETVLDMMCTDGELRPKVIGSTATIGQARRQVRALFDRPVLQFPPSGFDAADSFFAIRDEIGPDRLYLGLCSAGRSPKFALQAAAAALLESAAELLRSGASAKSVDPFWTCVLYFNSLRELGGAHVLLQDDVPRQMAFLASRLGAKSPRNLENDAIELSSRVPSRDLPDYLGQLAIQLGASDDDPFAPTPMDAVLASNMISVGVDVPRLGLMVVNGQPKSTAEYIQASSRVGRGVDGLVLTLYNFGRPRDVSHFEHFSVYHRSLYRSVEATSVTPWAPRARDKALHAVVAAAVRHLCPAMDDEDAAMDFDATSAEVQKILEAIRQRADSASEGIETVDAAADLQSIADEWDQRSASARATGGALLYWEKKRSVGAPRPHLMTSAEDGPRPGGLAWPTPNSMREVEPSTAFSLKLIPRH